MPMLITKNGNLQSKISRGGGGGGGAQLNCATNLDVEEPQSPGEIHHTVFLSKELVLGKQVVIRM